MTNTWIIGFTAALRRLNRSVVSYILRKRIVDLRTLDLYPTDCRLSSVITTIGLILIPKWLNVHNMTTIEHASHSMVYKLT